ncbi:acyltransferase family protein [Fundicoccus sp. Sow4_F4]|uniref:acyltransferase family protein n=1 Tax=Fundicoccus sp. Sow4_F4 TaxID=3438783 RepID=UPI003F8DF6C1
MQNKTQNYTIDKFKFIAAIAVVLIHVTAFLETEDLATFANYYWYRHLLNFAVPFFFATTGYLIAQQTETVRYVRNQLTKTLVMYSVFTLFYIVIDGLIFIPASLTLDNTLAQALGQYLNTLTLTKFLNGQIGHYHLWYLWALFLASLILYHLLKRGFNATQILMAASVLYLVALYIISKNAHADLLANGGFPKALISLSAGYYISQRNITLKSGLVISSLLMLAYQRLSLSDIQCFAGETLLILAIAALMTYINQTPGRQTPLAKLASYSMEIYLFHPILLTIYSYTTNVQPQLEIEHIGLRITLLTTVTIAASVTLYPSFKRYYIDPTEKHLDPILDTLITTLTQEK